MLKRALLTLAIPTLLAWGTLPATASAGQYLITVVSAQITPKKSKYKRWDTGFGRMPLPDPYLIMEVSGQRFVTPVLSNTITPKWNVSWKVTLNGTERLYFVALDKDLGNDDEIGKGDVLLSKAHIPFSFGKVLKLTLKVERLDPPPPPRRDVVRTVPVKPDTPVIRRAAPVVRRVTPVIRQVAPVVRRAAPVVRRVAPVVRRVAPVIKRIIPPVRARAALPTRPAVRPIAKPVVRPAIPTRTVVPPTSRPASRKAAPKAAPKPAARKAPASQPAKREAPKAAASQPAKR